MIIKDKLCTTYENLPGTICLLPGTTGTKLHYPVEGEALEHREHEHRTEEHDVRFADREPRFTTPSS